MAWFDFIWNDEPGGNVEHVLANGITPTEFEQVVCDPVAKSVSRSSGRPIATGYTSDGGLIVVVYEVVDECTIYPVTAFAVEPHDP